MNKIIDDCNAHRGFWSVAMATIEGLLAFGIAQLVLLSTGDLPLH